MKPREKCDCLVIGGGPAGMTAALLCARNSRRDIVLVEKNRQLGRKLLITGAGRCNLTNARMGPSFFPRHSSNRLVRNLLSKYTTVKIREFFDSLGLELVERDKGRMFPVSEQAKTVVDLLEAALREAGVRILTGRTVEDLAKDESGTFQCRFNGNASMQAKQVIVAAGGMARPETGSNGLAYRWLSEMGHSIVDPRPGLVPLAARLGPLHKLQGQKWHCRLSLLRDGTKQAESEGDVLFTDYGLSGLAVLDLTTRSAPGIFYRGARKERQENPCWSVVIDFKPGKDRDSLRTMLKAMSHRFPGRRTEDLLKGILPMKIARFVSDCASSANRIEAVLDIIGKYTVEIKGTRGWAQAQITCGGADTREVDDGTMQSLIVPGLFMSGEILDIHGVSGGYNLHVAWATGLAAGEGAARAPLY